jgi:hypothetical protein
MREKLSICPTDEYEDVCDVKEDIHAEAGVKEELEAAEGNMRGNSARRHVRQSKSETHVRKTQGTKEKKRLTCANANAAAAALAKVSTQYPALFAASASCPTPF